MEVDKKTLVRLERCADMLINIDLNNMTKAERNIAFELGMLDLLNYNSEKNVWERVEKT